MVGLLRRCRWLAAGAVALILLSTTIPALGQGRGQGARSCMATPDQLLGQAFGGTAGAAGEIGEDGLTPEGEDIEAEGLAAESEWILENLQYSESGGLPVAILIVDDFSSDGTEDEDEPVSHGWLVYEVFTQLHDLLEPEIAEKIILEQVDISGESGYRSDLVVAALTDTIDRLSEEGVQRFVINMSFVILPCVDEELNFDFDEFIAQRRDDPDHSIVEAVGNDPAYVRSLLRDSRVTYVDETGLSTDEAPERERGRSAQDQPGGQGGPPQFVEDQLRILRLLRRSQLQSDPLRDFFRNSRELIIPVASSGNFKGREPLFPARWSEVLSVSATEGNDLRFWTHSNNADVTVPGAWYLFEDEVYRAGTSFAAPVVSLLLAVDLTQQDPTCAKRGNAPVLAHGNFDNTLLLDAVEGRC